MRAARTNAELNKVNYSTEKSELKPYMAKNLIKIRFNFCKYIITRSLRCCSSNESYFRKKGEIILSGLILSQKNEMLTICQQSGFKLIEEQQQDDWLGLRLKLI